MSHKNIFFIITLVFLLTGFLYLAGIYWPALTARGSASDNLSGYAWSENIGWISFNCVNNNSCASSPYGVNINPATGAFSGYAWSENIGWIDFAPAGSYPSAPNYSAKLDLATNKASGWARALANGDGWDGWIKLAGANYEVIRSGCDLTQWAWGSDVMGWISFRGANYGVTSALCSNSAPTATAGAATQPDYCSSGPAATLSWTFSDPEGQAQSAYQVQLDNNSDFSSPEADSGKIISTSNSYNTGPGKLVYGSTYYWRVKVWDNGAPSMESNWASGTGFGTPAHAYPTANFSQLPSNPSANQLVNFTDQSIVYGGTTKSAWAWTFQDATPPVSSAQNPAGVKFASNGAKQVSLGVTDSDNITCSTIKTINVKLPLPKIKEVAPR